VTSTLSAAFLPNDRTRPLLDGTVQPEGIALVATPLYAPEMFWRQLKFADFDVSEMSIASLAIAIAGGSRDWVALPVFSMRRFFHSEITVRNDAAIVRPSDLHGKRVGVPEYQQTGAVWCRGVLADEFGVDPREIRWFMERTPTISHGGATGFTPPPGIRLDYIDPGSDIGRMLVDGSLDATLLYIPAYVPNPTIVDRSSAKLDTVAHSLFADPVAEAHRYFKKTGVYPINHCVVIRRPLIDRDPGIARSLFDAFVTAKARVAARRMHLLEAALATGVLPSARGIEDDVMAYGIDANRVVLETLTRYLFEQGLTPRRLELSDIFAAV